MTRFAAILVAVAALALTACGGDGGDSKSPQTPSAASTTGAARAPSSTGTGATKRKRSRLEETVLAPKPGTPRLAGRRRVAYLKAKGVCDSAGVKGIARRYGLHERNAVIVARAYSEKAFAPPAQGAGFAGCVAGFR